MFPYFDVKQHEGTCLWRALVNSAYQPIDLVVANIYPWTVSFKRADMRIFENKGILPWFYTYGTSGYGHVSLQFFRGASFGFNPAWARKHNFASDEPKVTNSFLAPPIAALGHVKPMLSQVPATTTKREF